MIMFRGRFAQERQFVDTLQVGTLGGAGWGSNPTVTSWTWDTANTVPCFVEDLTPSEVRDGTEATISDAIIYLASSNTSITGVRRVKVTHRYRTALPTAEIYEVLGDPLEGRSCRVLNCRRITGNSGS